MKSFFWRLMYLFGLLVIDPSGTLAGIYLVVDFIKCHLNGEK